MKVFRSLLLSITFFAALSFSSNAQQDSTGMPGDNFSLQGALEMFKQSGSPEEFEKLINTEDKNVNNLDLNGDGDIDYIKVIDKSANDVHAFILQIMRRSGCCSRDAREVAAAYHLQLLPLLS